MWKKVLFLCVLVSCNNFTNVEALNQTLFERVKRDVYNYFYGSYDQQPSNDYYVNECGYISSSSNSYLGYVNINENCVPETKTIFITYEELDEVIPLAEQIWFNKCGLEDALINLDIGDADLSCAPSAPLSCIANSASRVEIIHDILKNRHAGEFKFCDDVVFTTNTSLPTEVCDPDCATDTPVTELDRLLPPFCVLENSKYLRYLPSPRALSLLFDQYKSEEYTSGAPCLNSFGFFFFQLVSHDIQFLVNKRTCTDGCVTFTGCSKDNSIALVDNLRTDAVDVINVCSADPFYSYYGVSCITSPKVQTINYDCTIRKRAAANIVTPGLDMSFLYCDTTVPGTRGLFPNSGNLNEPILCDPRAEKTTPIFGLHVLFTFVHNDAARKLALIIPEASDQEIFDLAQLVTIAIYQLLLYKHLLPTIFGADANAAFGFDNIDNCYDEANTLEVPVEVISVALRYCHAYIPSEYNLYDVNGVLIEKKDLHDVLSTAQFEQFGQDVVRGMLIDPVVKSNGECHSKYSQSLPKNYKDDLRALDVQAARDACVQPLVQYLEKFYNISSTSTDFNSYNMFFSNDKLQAIKYLYSNPQQIELIVAALSNRYQSLFPDLFKVFAGTYFRDLKCTDPNFWSNLFNGDLKTFLDTFDVQDYIACVIGLPKRPYNIFCPVGTDNLLVPVTCESATALNTFLISISGGSEPITDAPPPDTTP